jgi:excisionase family DNA binding protein
MNSDPISVSIPTACRMSGLSRSHLYKVMARGDVRSLKMGRRRLVLVDSLRAWLESLPSGGLAITAPSGKGKQC